MATAPAGGTRRRPLGVRGVHDRPPAVGGVGLTGQWPVGQAPQPGLGVATRDSPDLLPAACRQTVERATKPRVDRAARQIEKRRDLARRVVEQVAQRDDRPLLRTELRQRDGHLVGQRLGGGINRRDVGRRGIAPRGGAPASGPRRWLCSRRSGAARERRAAGDRSDRAHGRPRETTPGPRPRRPPRRASPPTPHGKRPPSAGERAPRTPRRSPAERPGRGAAREDATRPRRGGRRPPSRPRRRQRGHWPVADHVRCGASHALHPKSLRAPARWRSRWRRGRVRRAGALGRVAITFLHRAPRLVPERRGEPRARRARALSGRCSGAVRARAGRGGGSAAPSVGGADPRPSLAPPRPHCRGTRQPALLRRLVLGERDPRARPLRRSNGALRPSPARAPRCCWRRSTSTRTS